MGSISIRHNLEKFFARQPKRKDIDRYIFQNTRSAIAGKDLHLSPYDGLAKFPDGYADGHSTFDSNAVIIFANAPLHRRYHFSLISRWGLSAIKHFQASGDQSAIAAAFAQAEYLKSQLTPLPENSGLTLLFPFEGGGAAQGWSSAISNGAAADLFLHLGMLTNDVELVKTSEGLARSFTKPIAAGGLVSAMARGGWFFEEYAGSDVKVRYVLNGHLLGMMHIFTWILNYGAYKNADRQLLAQVIDSFHWAALGTWLALDDFDVTSKKYGKTTYYDLSIRSIKPATAYPHRIHVLGAAWLGEIYRNRYFSYKSEQWQKMRDVAIARFGN